MIHDSGFYFFWPILYSFRGSVANMVLCHVNHIRLWVR